MRFKQKLTRDTKKTQQIRRRRTLAVLQSQADTFDVVIIGSGMGGLSAGDVTTSELVRAPNPGK
eukprot:3887048-Amphidinium_carterae.1